LDAGCAKGYLVDLLNQNGVDAWGIDFSRYAIEAAPDRIRNRVAVGDVLDLKFADASFDLVACIETLEHLTPERAIQAASELYRVTSDKLWVTIPSVGVNDFGPPDGWPQGKIRAEALPRYSSNRDHPDPAPYEDLMLDENGYPIHGHLIVASYRWWTELFALQGFVRCGDIETNIIRNEPLVSGGQWSSYVFEKPRAAESALGPLTGEPAFLLPWTDWSLASDGPKTVPSHWDLRTAILAPSADDPGSRLLSCSSIQLAPGWYEVQLRLGIQASEAVTNRWAEIAVLDVRSSKRQRIHALRTVRRRDLSLDALQTFSLVFASNGEPDFEFRILCGRSCVLDTSTQPRVHRLRHKPRIGQGHSMLRPS
jgi:hypothetical protein